MTSNGKTTSRSRDAMVMSNRRFSIGLLLEACSYGMDSVPAAVSLAVFAYNLRRVINIVGVPQLLAVLCEQAAARSCGSVRRLLTALLRRLRRFSSEFSYSLTTG